MYCIIKKIINEKNIVIPVIVLDDSEEVLEFTNREEAEKLASLFQKNSDSGHDYVVKEI